MSWRLLQVKVFQEYPLAGSVSIRCTKSHPGDVILHLLADLLLGVPTRVCLLCLLGLAHTTMQMLNLESQIVGLSFAATRFEPAMTSAESLRNQGLQWQITPDMAGKDDPLQPVWRFSPCWVKPAEQQRCIPEPRPPHLQSYSAVRRTPVPIPAAPKPHPSFPRLLRHENLEAAHVCRSATARNLPPERRPSNWCHRASRPREGDPSSMLCSRCRVFAGGFRWALG